MKGASGTEQRQSLVLRSSKARDGINHFWLPRSGGGFLEELMFGPGLRKGRGKGENEPSERMVGGQ